MSDHCMNGPAKAHTLHMVGIIKALKAAAVTGSLPATREPLPFVSLARAIVDHWPSSIDQPDIDGAGLFLATPSEIEKLRRDLDDAYKTIRALVAPVSPSDYVRGLRDAASEITAWINRHPTLRPAPADPTPEK